VRYRSPKKEAEYRQRRPLVERLLRERPECEACELWAGYEGKRIRSPRPSTDVHEIRRRSRGGSILDERLLLCLCRQCHDQIGRYPSVSEQLGLEVPSWGGYDVVDEAERLRKGWIAGIPFLPYWWPDDDPGQFPDPGLEVASEGAG